MSLAWIGSSIVTLARLFAATWLQGFDYDELATSLTLVDGMISKSSGMHNRPIMAHAWSLVESFVIG